MRVLSGVIFGFCLAFIAGGLMPVVHLGEVILLLGISVGMFILSRDVA